MANTILKHLSTSGAILTIDFDDFLSIKRIMKYVYQKKIDLTYLTGNFIGVFTHKGHPGGARIHEIKESFPLKPFLDVMHLGGMETTSFESRTWWIVLVHLRAAF